MSIQRRFLHLFNSLRSVSTDVFQNQPLDWWSDPKMRPLRAMNQLRVPLIRDTLSPGKSSKDKPLKGYKLLDVGCGGGLLAEPLARLGADVTAIDTSEKSIDAASEHLRHFSPYLQPHLKYLLTSIEEFAKTDQVETYDAVVASEVVEHVTDVEAFFQNCEKILKPHGSLFVTTINQTVLAYVIDILLAEKALQILPDGTHQYNMFVPPTSLIAILEESKNANLCVNITNYTISDNFTVKSIQGMVYNFLSSRWNWCTLTHNNYAVVAFKNREEISIERHEKNYEK